MGAYAGSVGASERPARRWNLGGIYVQAATAVVLATISVGGVSTIESPGSGWSRLVRIQAVVLIIGPAVFIQLAVMRRTFGLAIATYWSWSFVFMGLAPAYQMSANAFPWGGQFNNNQIAHAQQVVMLGHIAVLAGVYWVQRARKGSDFTEDVKTSFSDYTSTRRLVTVCLWVYASIGLIFIALMGPSLYADRANFRVQLLAIANAPFGGTLFFLATAGAITVPAVGIACRRRGIAVPLPTLILATIIAAVVTNPLLGSRFLTGSFVVAVGASLLGPTVWARALPAASIVLLVVLFPSLDVLRGDGSGSQTISIQDASTSLLTYNFDAFEMLARETSLAPPDRAGMPPPIKLAVAPVVKWIPIVARPFVGDASGSAVAQATGMNYTNVSMPLWGEGDIIGGYPGVVIIMLALGTWLGTVDGRYRRRSEVRNIAFFLVRAPSAALLFIVLRGSLYEVFGYLALSVILGIAILRKLEQDVARTSSRRQGISAGTDQELEIRPHSNQSRPAATNSDRAASRAPQPTVP